MRGAAESWQARSYPHLGSWLGIMSLQAKVTPTIATDIVREARSRGKMPTSRLVFTSRLRITEIVPAPELS